MVKAVFGVTCRYVSPSGFALQDNIKATHLYRIAQEAVNNAVRHGQARHIRIVLGDAAGFVCLAIHDDGDGLPMGWQDNRGMGLHNMTYRAQQIGGRLDIGQRKPRGTTVMCRVRR